MPYRCRDCRKHFSVRKGSVLQSSKVGYRVWIFALYMMCTGIKGTASMEVYRSLGVSQRTAWFLMHRVREGFDLGANLPFPGPVEVDEAFFGGRRRNMHAKKRKQLSGRGTVGKGCGDRRTGSRLKEGRGKAHQEH